MRPTFAFLAVTSLAGWLLCSPVHATGLGALQVRSFLGERLDAYIPFKQLSLASEKELSQCFSVDRSGTNESGFPAVYPTLNVEGNAERGTLVLSTAHPMTEPVSMLRIRSHCEHGGESVREYTFFLDPPPPDKEASDTLSVPSQQVFLPVLKLLPKTDSTTITQEPAPVVAGRGETWKVRKGDSIARIAQRFEPNNGTKQRKLEKAIIAVNPKLINPNQIRIGDELLIPDVLPLAESIQVAVAPSASPAPAKLPEAGKSERVPRISSQPDFQVKLSATQIDTSIPGKGDSPSTDKSVTDPDDKTAQLLAMKDKVEELEEKIASLSKQLAEQHNRSTSLAATVQAAINLPGSKPATAAVADKQLKTANTIQGADSPPYLALGVGAGILIATVFGASLIRKRPTSTMSDTTSN
ncbi:LysM peptidoglycan-binding domain-containing protein [Chitinivorax sp. B]|uniref:type IV pilus assembly protein FimV n=1 Tax=Chitinivorax sp. B TaxID=2502235 RepID=UPI0010F495E8|nr:LysM peptidoglycan-binding domain-containing protein [Chitinivorax sp. B]